MKRIALSILFLFIITSLRAQNASKVLSIGDKLTSQVSSYLLQGITSNRPNVNELKKKLIIVDFWNVWCSSCIASMPLLDSLQHVFGSRVEIIMVTSDRAERVKSLFSRLNIHDDLTFITDDTLLQYVFPHKTVPHVIWINDGIVRYITYAYNTTYSNIQNVLNGNYINMKPKLEYVDFDPKGPLWKEGNGRLDKYLKYYSLIMGELDDYGGGLVSINTDPQDGKVGIKCINRSLLDLYRVAYSPFFNGTMCPKERVIIKVKNPNKFKMPNDASKLNNWLSNNLYCYELSLPAVKSKNIYTIMQDDLDRFFPYTSEVVTTKIKCLCIKERRTNSNFVSSEDAVHYNISIKLNDGNTISLRKILSVNYPGEPIINLLPSFGKKKNITLFIPSYSLSIIKNELRRYNIDVIEKRMKLQMLIIRDKQN